MRRQEAAWIGEQLRALEGSRVVLNLGSGSKRFREVSKPYIDREIFDPLVRRGAHRRERKLRRRVRCRRTRAHGAQAAAHALSLRAAEALAVARAPHALALPALCAERRRAAQAAPLARLLEPLKGVAELLVEIG